MCMYVLFHVSFTVTEISLRLPVFKDEELGALSGFCHCEQIGSRMGFTFQNASEAFSKMVY